MAPLLPTATGILVALAVHNLNTVDGFSLSLHRTHHVHSTTLMSSSWNDDYDDSYRSAPSRGGSSTRQKSGRTRRSNGGGRSGRGRGSRDGQVSSGRGSGQPRPNRQSKESIRYPKNNFGYDDDDEYDSPNNNGDRMIQQQRMTNPIGCPLFGTCPGCVVDDYVADIDIVKSAQLYFSSGSIQKHISSSSRGRQSRGRYYDGDDEDDEFYEIKVPSSITQLRTQAKLAVASDKKWSRNAGCKIGLYQRHSHDVLPIPDCQVHHPSINKAVEAVVKATREVRTPAYQEDTGHGLLRYIQCQVELSTGKVCLTLVMNCEKLKECQPHLSYLVKELKRSEPQLWHSIWCHCNDSAGNAIFARDVTRWHPIEGPPYIREKLPGADPDPDSREGLLYFSPMVFRQANYEGFGEIAKQVREVIPNGSKVCELYAGVGLLGLSALLHHGKMAEEYDDPDGGIQWLRCSDENPENARCFERAVSSMPMKITGRSPKQLQKDNGKKGKRTRKNYKGKKSDKELSIKDLMDSMMSEASDESKPPPVDPSEKVTYMQASAAAAILKGQALGANVLIVDPPRKGLDEPVLQQLCQPYNPNQMYAEKPNVLSHMARHTVNWVNDVRTLIYVSCGFDALARDCDQLLSSNAGWKLESATGYVLFPGSNHVETVVVLRR